eukprot:gene20576-31688_t
MDMHSPAASPCSTVGELDFTYDNKSIEDIYKRWDNMVSKDEEVIFEKFVRDLATACPETEAEMNRAMSKLARRHAVPKDKVEVLVLGGTWSNYPSAYQEAFVRDLFYAANTFRTRNVAELPEKKSLAEEQAINETARCKVIGLTLETRPDVIDSAELRKLRRYGCTRVQIGLQHLDDGILLHINRGHDAAASREAIQLLKDNCFKIDAHLMPNLPGSSPELDEDMFQKVFLGEDYQVDQVKIYPCDVTPWTAIEKWFKEGTYKPYSEEKLREVILEAKCAVPPWVRLNRVIRDIPNKYIEQGPSENLRETVLNDMAKRGLRCKCIRCREAGDLGGRCQPGGGMRDGVAARRRANTLIKEAEVVIRRYKASDGVEYFVSFETPDRLTLFGFVRLRVTARRTTPADVFPELENAGLIRELHVYGQLIPTDEKEASHAQNAGLGKQLMAEAERIAFEDHTCATTAVIAGVGSRKYYEKLGYTLDTGDGLFMMKALTPQTLLPRMLRLAHRKQTHVPSTGYFGEPKFGFEEMTTFIAGLAWVVFSGTCIWWLLTFEFKGGLDVAD